MIDLWNLWKWWNIRSVRWRRCNCSANWAQTEQYRRERLRKLALETIDLSKDTTHHTRNISDIGTVADQILIPRFRDSDSIQSFWIFSHLFASLRHMPLDAKSTEQSVEYRRMYWVEDIWSFIRLTYTRFSAKLEGCLKSRSGLFL